MAKQSKDAGGGLKVIEIANTKVFQTGSDLLAQLNNMLK